MCGIAGLVNSEPDRVDSLSVVRRMQERLAHRGPDDRGAFVSDDGRCALAHTRLSILDLSSAGHQPMCLGGEWQAGKTDLRLTPDASLLTSPSGHPARGARYWIVFNGEVYNYKELRKALGVRGQVWEGRSSEHGAGSKEREIRYQRSEVGGRTSEYRTQETLQTQETRNAITWKSNSDTEVILRAYAKWGRECVNYLRGMFAFAIYDQGPATGDGAGELILARDPFGIKPLYYYQEDRVFLFASEVRALLASGLVPRKLSREGLAPYLQFGSVQDPFTMIDGVRSLLPGHSLRVRSLEKSLSYHESQHYNLNDSIANFQVSQSRNLESRRNSKSREAAATELRQILEDAVRAHLVSDVPVAAFLSGGIDSSAIVGLMSRVSDDPPRTFNVSFDEVEFSERSYANLIARKFGTEHEDIRLSAGTLVGMLPDALAAMDQPTMDGINTYVVSKTVRDAGIKVALSGLGSDELFGGYPSFRRAMQLGRLGRTPSTIRRLASTAGRRFTNGSARHRKFWDLVESDCSPYTAYSISRQLFSPSEIRCLLGPDAINTIDAKNAENSCQSKIQSRKSEIERDIINAVSRLELSGYMANTLLRDTDQMSMAHALEVRVPFVDSKVINYVLALPGEWKMNGGRPKLLLVDALGDLLPEEIWHRPKMGFALPFERWMCATLQSELDEKFSSASLGLLGVDAEHAKSVWYRFKKNPQHQPWSRPWALYVLAKWCELNDVTA
jgi:asparagine synthase (glutamine-hydrolysing)